MRTLLLAGPWWWSQAPAAAWERVACTRWRQRARLGAASRPQHREAGRNVVGERRVLRHGLLSVCCPVWGRAAGSGGGAWGRRQRQAHHGGRGLAGRRAEHGGVRRPPSLCQVPCQRPSPAVSRAWWHPAAQVVPRWVAAVGHREGRVPASVPSHPTTHWSRPRQWELLRMRESYVARRLTAGVRCHRHTGTSKTKGIPRRKAFQDIRHSKT